MVVRVLLLAMHTQAHAESVPTPHPVRRAWCCVCVCVSMSSQSTLPLRRRADKRYMFYWPVTEDVAPGYFTVIKQPMDLHTIYQRLQVRLAGGTAAANTTAPATPNAKAAGKGKGKGKADATVPSLDHVQFRQMFEQICANALTFNSPQVRVMCTPFAWKRRPLTSVSWDVSTRCRTSIGRRRSDS